VLDPRHTKAPLANRIEQSAPAAAVVYLSPLPPQLPTILTCLYSAAQTATNQSRGTRRRRGRGGRSGPSGAGRRPKKTVEDLDAEMTDYFDTGVAVATAPTS
jgi:C-terminal duplication domain of Friend of PRMT1